MTEATMKTPKVAILSILHLEYLLLFRGRTYREQDHENQRKIRTEVTRKTSSRDSFTILYAVYVLYPGPTLDSIL